MTEQTIEDWLCKQILGKDLAEISTRTIRLELDNLVSPSGDQHEIEWPRLILAASILARSSEREHLEAALRISTGAFSLQTNVAIRDAGAVLLQKLSNMRSFYLAQKRMYVRPGLDSRIGVALRAEIVRKRIDESILVDDSGSWLSVNKFQKEFWNNADRSDWISASAPTASGKSFIVMQWIVNSLRGGAHRTVVYIAPTRALVSEVEGQVNSIVSSRNDISVSSLPLGEGYEGAKKADRPIVFVLTQERFHLLANSLGDEPVVDMLIVDEAHKIGDNQRGIILQDAIERMQRKNAQLKVVFLSPATQNPEELLKDAPKSAKVVSLEKDLPTVLQNVVWAEQVPGAPKAWKLSGKVHGSHVELGELKLKSSPSTTKKKLAFIAAAVGERGGTLVYANTPSEAEEVAALLSQLVPKVKMDPELAALADLARKGVHKGFALASLVENGVAFHYGNLPSLIRLEVERLFRSGAIRFLVCTSTLIEGVNISCRTIVLRGPRKGKGHPMAPHDFWNLAGRAGRWGDEFQGNIVCIEPRNKSVWPNGVPSRARYPIKRESDAVLEKHEELIKYLWLRLDSPVNELADVAKFEHVGAYLLSTYIRRGSLSSHIPIAHHHADAVAGLEPVLKAMADKVDLPAEVVIRHPGVSALGLQQLLAEFKSYKRDIGNLVPAPAESDDSYDRFITVMERVNRTLFPAFSPKAALPVFSLTVTSWLRGHSLASMIKRSIKYHEERNKPYKLPSLIRSTMENVEQIARFKAPKYFSAYVDVLNFHLAGVGRSDLIHSDVDIGTQLELGVSSRTLISLMQMGISRMSAVALYELMARDDMTKDQCVEWIQERSESLPQSEVPQIVIREVEEKLQLYLVNRTN